ncbi:gamma-glutamylcyclotransferase family protein [Hydrogenovibrio kuenenii]|uniref:gamma-glutamylcyclotransferase family protein n=1 Tax=Hydrogenovibrio kuenenii TaxID=63658 RepID=UPI000464EA60|nr:gamma-glutamylcyclotransferase family protein [Hydrogenovibrio kuenenii]
MPKHIFTYGSLMYPEVWQQLVKGNYDSCQANLSGYHRKSIHQQDYPAVFQDEMSKNKQVLGRVYFDVSPDDQVTLDTFEGEEYDRLTERLFIPDLGEIEVEVYVFKPDYLHRVTDEDWDVEAFEAEGLQRFLNQYKGFQ